ncbi:MAG: NYN domain-containing protein [Anaerolineae bacterium]|nr:NYN domain-containing protein [Anaerolineae bacterium]
MLDQALFVDLPNFYNGLLNSRVGEERSLRDYFLYWFDFDLLSQTLTREFSPVWLFYSGQRFGPSSNRIQGEYLNNFISRINSLRGVTARDVNIPGRQREPASFKCENCGHAGIAEWESEKGIDASLTTHLFDTMDTWDVAFLLSGDADFVPVVASLRRRGKIVIGAGFANPSSALVRECYDYIDLSTAFISDDFVAYEILKEGGLVGNWLTHEVRTSDATQTDPIELSFEWQKSQSDALMKAARFSTITDVLSHKDPHYPIYLTYQGPLDPTDRYVAIHEFAKKFPQYVEEYEPSGRHCKLIVSPVAWEGVHRRFDQVIGAYGGLREWEARNSGAGYTLNYHLNNDTGQYEMINE